MDPIRVLLVGMSGILREIIREFVARQADMTVVGDLRDDLDLVPTARQTHSDVVIIVGSTEDGGRLPESLRLLDTMPVYRDHARIC